MSKTQITYVYGSNITSRSNQFKNYPHTGPTTPYTTEGVTSTASLLPGLGYLGAGGIFLFYSGIIQGPPLSYCADADGNVYGEGNTSPGDICVTCVGGEWVHKNHIDRCNGWGPGILPNIDDHPRWVPACTRSPNMGCHLCGSCDECVSDGDGGYSCQPNVPTEAEILGCVRCVETNCNKGGWKDICGELSCCSGVCYNPNIECTHTDGEGECALGCPDGQICRSAQCEDIYIQSLVLLESLIP